MRHLFRAERTEQSVQSRACRAERTARTERAERAKRAVRTELRCRCTSSYGQLQARNILVYMKAIAPRRPTHMYVVANLSYRIPA